MMEQWQELKETIIELRDNNGTGTQQEACKFLANLMNVLEKQMQEPKWIPVSKRSPEDGEDVLICYKKWTNKSLLRIIGATYYNGEFYTDNGESYRLSSKN